MQMTLVRMGDSGSQVKIEFGGQGAQHIWKPILSSFPQDPSAQLKQKQLASGRIPTCGSLSHRGKMRLTGRLTWKLLEPASPLKHGNKLQIAFLGRTAEVSAGLRAQEFYCSL